MPEPSYDLVVLGAGPAGLGAGLAAARAGARVAVLEAAPGVGGLCRTIVRGGVRFDVGGHVPFVRDRPRLDWLRDLLGADLGWVPRPVSSWRDGIRPGRYLDQRADGPLGSPVHPMSDPPPAAHSAARVLHEMFGAAWTDANLRPYLEKIDGVPLERMPGTRPLRLMRDQAAPEGFWFPRLGIGQLMDAMRDRITAHGGTVRTGTPVTAIHTTGGAVTGVQVSADGASQRIGAPALVVASAPTAIAGLLDPSRTAGTLRMRAVVLVVLRVPGAPLTPEAWVQVDHPGVPASRIMEVPHWSPAMVPPDTTVLGFECYCHPTPDDPVWGAEDAELVAACTGALRHPLGWLPDGAACEPVAVLRFARAFPLQDMSQAPVIAGAVRTLTGLGGVRVAPGAAVIEAIEAGEHAAGSALA